MRIEELHLERFGPFTDTRITFGGGSALQVVHGPNATGKTTALRAISALLYGIPARTRDAHTHPYDSLRIGARIAPSRGEAFSVVRKKGTKNTLLDPTGAVLDEVVLGALLGGVGLDQFLRTFGLDQRSLREGANALLSGTGDVGESLFDAATGGRGIHAVLAELEARAEEIFAARASKKALNVAIAAFKDAQGRLKDAGVDPKAYAEQEAEVAEALAQSTALAKKIDELERERLGLERDHRAHPAVLERIRLRKERAALGNVPRTDVASVSAREDAMRRRSESERERTLHEADVARLGAQLETLEVDEALVAIGDDVVRDLSDRLGSHRKERADLPRREAEKRAAELRARGILERLGRPGSLESARGLRVTVERKAAIRALATRHGALETAAESARRRCDALFAELDRARASLAEAPREQAAEPLERAVERALRLGDPDRALAEAAAKVERHRAAMDRARLLPDPEDALRVAPPPVETIDALARERDALERRLDESTEHVATLERRLRDLDEELARDALAGEVPTEADLVRERRERERLWGSIKRAVDAQPSGRKTKDGLGVDSPDPAEYEQAVRRADDVGDRLRREADRVASHAARLAARDRARAELADEEKERSSIDARIAALDEEHRASWAALGVEAGRPAAMRAWLDRFASLVKAATAWDEARAEVSSITRRVEEARASLVIALAGDAAVPSPAGERSIEALLAHAKDALKDARAAAERRRKAAGDVERLAGELADADRERRESDEALGRWRTDWERATAELVTTTGSGPDEVTAVLDALDELAGVLDAIAALENRIAAMHADGEAFDAAVDALTEKHARDLAALAAADRASALLDRVRSAKDQARAHRQLAQDVDEKRASIARAAQIVAHADEELRALGARVGARDLEELVAMEARSREASELDAAIAKCEEQIRDAAEGVPTDAVEAAVRDVDRRDLKMRAENLAHEIAALREERDELARELGRKQQGLEAYRQRTSSIDLAEETASHLTRVKALAHEWARLRLASSLLHAEVARYRDEHQGPVLGRASELFPRLTLEKYRGLRVGIGASDHPVIKCVLAAGGELDFDALSVGELDQLYLALRLATLEQHASRNEPLPLVLDDILDSFDPARARAALQVLADVSSVFQIILFTHHDHVVDLARDAVAADALRVHDLETLRGRLSDAGMSAR